MRPSRWHGTQRLIVHQGGVPARAVGKVGPRRGAAQHSKRADVEGAEDGARNGGVAGEAAALEPHGEQGEVLCVPRGRRAGRGRERGGVLCITRGQASYPAIISRFDKHDMGDIEHGRRAAAVDNAARLGTADRGLKHEVDGLMLARALSGTVALLARAAGRTLAPWRLTWPQAMSLLVLRAEAGPINATRLVEQLGLGRTAMTAVVDRLQRRGWVARRPHPRDRRMTLVALTDAGRRVADEAADALVAHFDAVLARARLPARFEGVTLALLDRLGMTDDGWQ
jgi:DNA-binding MarR family transcriptional regulator